MVLMTRRYSRVYAGRLVRISASCTGDLKSGHSVWSGVRIRVVDGNSLTTAPVMLRDVKGALRSPLLLLLDSECECRSFVWALLLQFSRFVRAVVEVSAPGIPFGTAWCRPAESTIITHWPASGALIVLERSWNAPYHILLRRSGPCLSS